MKRSPLKRSTPLRRTPFKRGGNLKRSEFKPKPTRDDIPTATRKKVAERSGGYCEIRLPDICTGYATQIDHIKNRRQASPEERHSMANLQHACFQCHHWKTTHPKEAAELGIWRHAWE